MEVNPVGVADVEVIRDRIDEVIEAWMVDHPEVKSWWRRISVGWIEVVGFLVKAGDYFIKTIDKVLDSGPDKKATVMAAMEEVYDYIVPNLLPIWLKPFSGQVKNFVFGVLINFIVDYFVGKYRAGEWNNVDVTQMKFM
jgi:ABC-type cobalt transport system substrate-binding protein